MEKIIYKVCLALLLTVPATVGAWADDYNPENPPEPLTRYVVTVSAEPAEAGYVSGGGKYSEGTPVGISTSVRNSNYEFLYWMQDGVRIDQGRSFTYTMEDKKTHFVAVYGFNPTNPQEPTGVYSYHLFLTTDADGSCTFNMANGQKVKAGQKVRVAAEYITPGYVFKGWYLGDELLSSSASFQYLMPDADVTLTARLVYDPANPSDPNGNQDNVDDTEGLKGDVNQDGKVNVGDIMAIINIMAGQGGNNAKADVNGDGNVNVGDIMAVINIMAGK